MRIQGTGEYGFRTLADEDTALANSKQRMGHIVTITKDLGLQMQVAYVTARTDEEHREEELAKIKVGFVRHDSKYEVAVTYRWESTHLVIDLVEYSRRYNPYPEQEFIYGFYLWERDLESLKQLDFRNAARALANAVEDGGYVQVPNKPFSMCEALNWANRETDLQYCFMVPFPEPPKPIDPQPMYAPPQPEPQTAPPQEQRRLWQRN